MIALFVQWRLRRKGIARAEESQRKQVGTLIACGLVAGAALMDVLLAIPFSIRHSPDALKLVGAGWETYGTFLGILSTLLLAAWISHRVCTSSE